MMRLVLKMLACGQMLSFADERKKRMS